MPLLNAGDPFPALTVNLPGGLPLHLPGAFAGSYGVVLLYRGSWCPFCNAQLRAFQRQRESRSGLGIQVVAMSVDDEATTQALIEKHKLGFPVGFGADADELALLTGAFVNPSPVFVQSTGFVLDPQGTVIVSVYSSGAIGRLMPDDVAGLVGYHQSQAAASSSAEVSTA